MATIEERVTALEEAYAEVTTALATQTESIAREGLQQREAIRLEGARVTDRIAGVNEAVVKVSTGLLTLQQQVTKWAAAGSLAGAVVLFIAVRALGF